MSEDNELMGLRALKAQQLRTGLEKAKTPSRRPPLVEVYSTPSCQYCQMAKRYLMDKKIPFQDIDVSRSHLAAQKMVMETGQTGVPQLHINGNWIVGFDRHAIDEALSQQGE